MPWFRSSSLRSSEITCRWADRRIGSVRALRPYGPYGAVVCRKGGAPVRLESAGALP